MKPVGRVTAMMIENRIMGDQMEPGDIEYIVGPYSFHRMQNAEGLAQVIHSSIVENDADEMLLSDLSASVAEGVRDYLWACIPPRDEVEN